jgi:hypothetical protein
MGAQEQESFDLMVEPSILLVAMLAWRGSNKELLDDQHLIRSSGRKTRLLRQCSTKTTPMLPPLGRFALAGAHARSFHHNIATGSRYIYRPYLKGPTISALAL